MKPHRGIGSIPAENRARWRLTTPPYTARSSGMHLTIHLITLEGNRSPM
jgi:hypothetical protein